MLNNFQNQTGTPVSKNKRKFEDPLLHANMNLFAVVNRMKKFKQEKEEEVFQDLKKTGEKIEDLIKLQQNLERVKQLDPDAMAILGYQDLKNQRREHSLIEDLEAATKMLALEQPEIRQREGEPLKDFIDRYLKNYKDKTENDTIFLKKKIPISDPNVDNPYWLCMELGNPSQNN